MHTVRLAGVALITIVVGASCSDSTSPAIDFTDQEARQALAAMFEVLEDADGANDATAQPVSVAMDVMPINGGGPCPGGGTVSYVGTQDDDTGGAEVSVSYAACQRSPFTFNGTIAATVEVTSASQAGFTVVYTLSGPITVAIEDRGSRSCTINITRNFTITFGQNGEEVEVVRDSGTFCSRTLSG